MRWDEAMNVRTSFEKKNEKNEKQRYVHTVKIDTQSEIKSEGREVGRVLYYVISTARAIQGNHSSIQVS